MTASIDSGPHAKTTTTALHVPGFADIAGTTSDTGAVRSYTFSVSASVQAAGSEAPVAFTVDAVDDAGYSTLPNAVGTGSLLIDDAAPRPGGVDVKGGVPGTDGVLWFRQTASALIEARVIIQEHGSGVNISALKLMSEAAQLDNGAPHCAESSTFPAVLCQFFIDPHTPIVPAGGQAEITFTVAGQDMLGNAIAIHQAKIGIDGKAPVIMFTPVYPPAGTDCNAGGTDPDNIFCGHDGSHFFRAGDAHSLSFAVNDDSGDVGSGADATSGTCTIAGTTCTATFNAAASTFTFSADFSAATFASGPDGTGDVPVTVKATDLVGNAAVPVQLPVHVTRVKWMRTMADKVDSFKGSPIATSIPVLQVIFGGSERGDALGPIASFAPDGAVLWRTGHNDITTVSNNVAYSPATKRLYVLGDNSTRMFWYVLGPGGVTSSFSCFLDDGTTVGDVVGSPAIAAGVPERLVVADSVGRLWSLVGTDIGCASVGNSLTNNGGTWLGLGSPAFDGRSVYVPHNATKLSTVAFADGVFGTVTDALLFVPSILGPVAIAGNVFFASQGVPGQVLSASPALTQDWSTATLLQDRLNAPTVVSAAFAFASPALNDGQIHALAKSTGAEAWHWPTGKARIGNISAPAIGADGVIYFSSDNPNQLIPLKVSATNTPSIATGWAEFKGSALQKTTSLIDTTVDSLTTEPVIDSGGVIYFGTTAGKVFALITDSGGPLLPVAGQTWPRVGFDNCNSSNTAFACQ